MPELLETYTALEPQLRRLLQEAHFVVETALDRSDIKVHGVSLRLKELSSLQAKLDKNGLDPRTCEGLLDAVTDLVGLRVICLYRGDIQRIVECLTARLNVVDSDFKEFGSGATPYQSTHLLATLPTDFAGARYDGILHIRFEVQIRTICMDAWASISHHLQYKNESSVPPEATRSFAALSGLLYVADTEFESLRDQIAAAHSRIEEAAASDLPGLAQEPLSIESIDVLLRTRLPNLEPGDREDLATLTATAHYMGVHDVGQMSEVIEQAQAGQNVTGAMVAASSSGTAFSALRSHDPSAYEEAFRKMGGGGFYCVNCKSRVHAIEVEKITMKNGRPASKAKCPNCGTKVFKIGG